MLCTQIIGNKIFFISSSGGFEVYFARLVSKFQQDFLCRSQNHTDRWIVNPFNLWRIIIEIVNYLMRGARMSTCLLADIGLCSCPDPFSRRVLALGNAIPWTGNTVLFGITEFLLHIIAEMASRWESFGFAVINWVR